MLQGIASTLALIRPTEAWSAWSIASFVLLVAAVVTLVAAWIVHVVTRR